MSNINTYIAIDLKSFYASVECASRNLNPLTTNLVVADKERTEKTICLAISPSLKKYGLPGRARLFEVIQKVKLINLERKKIAGFFTGKSSDDNELAKNPNLELDFIIAVPRMATYIKYSADIYDIYLKYIAPEDIHVYSIDEVFIDATKYLNVYKMTPEELTRKIIQDILKETGITATAGIGTNMYLAKVAMDIVAKHQPADVNGVRIAILDEMSYRKLLWTHEPLTDFWRVGRGYAKTLQEIGLYTMGDIAKASINNEDILYSLFGKNAELLIDHAWGIEPTTMEAIKKYQPSNHSIGSGQVLHEAYTSDKAEIIVKEMADSLALDLIEKKLVTNQLVISIGYDIENLKNKSISVNYDGEIKTDFFGRKVPKSVNGIAHINRYTSSSRIITKEVLKVYKKISNPNLLIKRLTLVACSVLPEGQTPKDASIVQLDIFNDYSNLDEKVLNEEKELSKEKKAQEAILKIKQKYGKNAIIKGMDLEEGATTIDRNNQIGGHKA